jgi:hypothetical protein
MFRVLRPGGRFCVSDIVATDKLPDGVRRAAGLYVGCIAGAIPEAEYLALIKAAGFEGIRLAKEQPIALPDETQSLADAEPDWERIVARYGLYPSTLAEIAPWWHVDADLGRTQECLTDMSRSRECGFLDYQKTSTAMFELFDRLRRERRIP